MEQIVKVHLGQHCRLWTRLWSHNNFSNFTNEVTSVWVWYISFCTGQICYRRKWLLRSSKWKCIGIYSEYFAYSEHRAYSYNVFLITFIVMLCSEVRPHLIILTYILKSKAVGTRVFGSVHSRDKMCIFLQRSVPCVSTLHVRKFMKIQDSYLG